MTTLNELQNIQDAYSYKNMGGESLLQKYNIPIQHFDFDYIAMMKNPNELEKIVEVLRSGQEGHFPDLLRAAECKLVNLRPNSEYLRRTTQVLNRKDLAIHESNQITDDLRHWVNDISRNNKELEEKKCFQPGCGINIRQLSTQASGFDINKKKSDKRLSSTDYEGWDRYDPDTEILKLELEEEKMLRRAQKASEKMKYDADKYIYGGTSQTNLFFEGFDNGGELKPIISEAEAVYYSSKELEKGREYFKSSDYELSLKYFTQSILFKADVVNLTERAVTFIKLEKYQECINDCDKALMMDKNNIEALLRKAQALEGSKLYEEALECIHVLINIDPNNPLAQDLANRVRPYCRQVLRNTRIKITEIE